MPANDDTPEGRKQAGAKLGGQASAEHQAIERYLRFLAGEWQPPESHIDKGAWEARIKDEPRLAQRVKLIADLERLESPVRKREALDAEGSAALGGFLRHGASFSARYGITYRAWRAMGVPPGVLRQIGLSAEYSPKADGAPVTGMGAPGKMRTRLDGRPSNRRIVLDLLIAAGDRGLTTREVRNAQPDMNTGTISGSLGGLRKMHQARFSDANQRWYITEDAITPERLDGEDAPPPATAKATKAKSQPTG